MARELIRRAVEIDPMTSKPRALETRICEGVARHRFEYPAGQTPTRCPVAGCEGTKSLREQKLRE